MTGTGTRRPIRANPGATSQVRPPAVRNTASRKAAPAASQGRTNISTTSERKTTTSKITSTGTSNIRRPARRAPVPAAASRRAVERSTNDVAMTSPSRTGAAGTNTRKPNDDEWNELDEEETETEQELLRKQRIDLAKFRIALSKKNLWLKPTGTDGNCFFRAVADQLYGYEFYHIRLRQEVVKFLKENKEEYKYFIENDIPIDRYIKLISQDGVWGG